MNILVVGGGGREHAIIHALRQNSAIQTIYALPGNGGIAHEADCVPIGAKDIDAIVCFAKEHVIDFAVVAQDDPLVLGAVDKLHALGIPCFGPEANAAILEGSKVFAKALMKKYNIPSAAYETFDSAQDALTYLETASFPIVIKADGLALGKGVLICEDFAQAQAAIGTIMIDKAFGASGNHVVIEEFLTGSEVSVLAFTDGKTVVPMVSSMDHKRALDGDQGLNTGGMGAIAPNPYYTEAIADECMHAIFQPTVDAMRQEGRPFKGCLYFGLMLTQDGPKVIEYNCRFGDPEAQVVLPLLKTDLFTVMQAVEEERLAEIEVTFSTGAACCVVLASVGYPQKYETDKAISLGSSDTLPDVNLYHAGTKLQDGALMTSGGRVLGVTAVGDTLAQAIDKAYIAAGYIAFEGAFYRRDIGQRALKSI